MDLANLHDFNYRGIFFLVIGFIFTIIFWSIFLSWSVRIAAKFYPSFKSIASVIFVWHVLSSVLELTPDILPGTHAGQIITGVTYVLLTFFLIAYLSQWLIITREKPLAQASTKFKISGVFLGLVIAFYLAMALLDYLVTPQLLVD